MNIHNLYRSFRNCAVMLFALVAMANPPMLQAQFSNSYNFLKAVRDRDGEAATDLLNRPGTTIVNTRELRTGNTALHIVVERRDATWLAFLLQRGADPNIANAEGLTPLMLATNLRYMDGMEVLLSKNANINQANSSGETPLIRAVQLRDLAMVRLLLKNGANPDQADNIAGQSARDYASVDARTASILAEIQQHDAAAKQQNGAINTDSFKVFGPTL